MNAVCTHTEEFYEHRQRLRVMQIAARAPVRARGEIKEVSLLLDALNTDKTAASLPEMNLNLLKV